MKLVVIDKKQQPISFNMAAMLECENALDVSLDTLLLQSDAITPDQYLKLAYLGLKYGCDEYNRKPPMSYSAFVDYVSKDNSVLTEILECVFKDIEVVLMLQAEKMNLNIEKEPEPVKKKEEYGTTTSVA